MCKVSEWFLDLWRGIWRFDIDEPDPNVNILHSSHGCRSLLTEGGTGGNSWKTWYCQLHNLLFQSCWSPRYFYHLMQVSGKIWIQFYWKHTRWEWWSEWLTWWWWRPVDPPLLDCWIVSLIETCCKKMWDIWIWNILQEPNRKSRIKVNCENKSKMNDLQPQHLGSIFP